MKRILILIIVATCVIGSLCSCGCTEMGEVSVFYYTFSDSYISGVRGAMDRMLDEGGVYYHNYDANSSQATQTEQIDTAIAKGSTMLIVNIVDSGSDDAARTIVEKAKAANIPLIFFNRFFNILHSY